MISSQDAHELFHVLTSSLEEERERLPKVPHFFDMKSLEVSLCTLLAQNLLWFFCILQNSDNSHILHFIPDSSSSRKNNNLHKSR